MDIAPGIYLVHKAVGESSFDVVRRFKREAREAGRKDLAWGHGGTLDPFAEGLLLVLAGPATRFMELMHPLPKTYVAEVAWGEETDTADATGLSLSRGDASALTPEALDEALAPFMGWIAQVPPATSAKKIEGEAAYKKAHRGEVVELPPSRVYLHEARWLSHELPGKSLLQITCRGGFYVRSLARDLGRALGCGAHLSRLRRTAIGPMEDPGAQGIRHLMGEALLPWCPARRLDPREAEALKLGRPIPLGEVQPPTWRLPATFPELHPPFRSLYEGRVVALLKEREGRLWPQANLGEGV